MSSANELFYTSRDGLRLHVRDYPAAAGSPARAPVICLHGLTRNADDFEDLAPRLAARGRRVLALDVRGRGRSAYDPRPGRYQIPVYADDVLTLLDTLRLPQAVFIGTSMGGLISMALSMKHPARIAAAVLNDVGPVLDEAGLARIRGYAGRARPVDNWEQATDYIAAINQSAFPGNDRAEWRRWAQRAFAEQADGRLVLRYDPAIAEALHNGTIRAHSWLARQAFRRLCRRPCLLVRGELSDLLGPAQRDAMCRMASTLQVVEVPGVGHAPMLVEPAAWAGLEVFFDRLDQLDQPGRVYLQERV